MISDFHKYHGAVLSVLSSTRPHTAINKLDDSSQGEYQINHNLGLYIKHATSDNNYWVFNFQPEHQYEIRRMFDRYHQSIVLALVCVSSTEREDTIDGVCLIEYGEYAAVISPDTRSQKAIRVERPDGGSYWVSGPSGSLSGAIRQNRFPQRIIELMTQG